MVAFVIVVFFFVSFVYQITEAGKNYLWSVG